MKKKSFTNEHYITEDTDYLYYVTKSSTKKQRKIFNIGNIYINGAVCKKCNEFIRSKHKHDFKWCSCKTVAVDGGSWYAKRTGKPNNYINVIESFLK